MTILNDEFHQFEVIMNVAVCLQVQKILPTRNEHIQASIFIFWLQQLRIWTICTIFILIWFFKQRFRKRHKGEYMTGLITTTWNNISVNYCTKLTHQIIILTSLMNICIVQSANDNKLACIEILWLGGWLKIVKCFH